MFILQRYKGKAPNFLVFKIASPKDSDDTSESSGEGEHPPKAGRRSAIATVDFCGYRIVAIMSAFQAEDTSSTLVTRSTRMKLDEASENIE